MGRRFRAQSANLLTACRVALTPVFVASVWYAPRVASLGAAAASLFALIALSDVLDGHVARRYGSESSAGRTLDHIADVSFILCALSTFVLQGVTPWWVPAAVGSAFAVYVIDSLLHAGRAPRLIGSWIGHVGGVLNYALVGILTFNNAASVGLLPPEVLATLFWLVPLYSAAAVLSRLSVWSPRRGLRAADEPCVPIGGSEP